MIKFVTLFIALLLIPVITLTQPTPVCDAKYRADVARVLSQLKLQLNATELKASQEYIELVRQRGEIETKLLIFERSFIKLPALQGMLRSPYSNYTLCSHINIVNPSKRY